MLHIYIYYIFIYTGRIIKEGAEVEGSIQNTGNRTEGRLGKEAGSDLKRLLAFLICKHVSKVL